MTTVTPYEYQSLTEAAARISAGALSPVSLTEQLLARVDRLNPNLHAYRSICRDEALAQARLAEREIKSGAYRGPLHGMPVALKDNIWYRAAPTTNGLAINDEYWSPADATVVRRLLAAGAVILGKLAQTEGAFAEHRPDTPIPINPWDAERWVGVSSSGPGVAVAAHLCMAALGTDTGGSIRFPSAMNNLTSMKPTWGRVSRFGVFDNSASMDHVGPMARSVDDVAAVLKVVAGRDAADPTASRRAVPDYVAHLTRSVHGMRVALDRRYVFEGVDDATTNALSTSVEVLSRLGVTIVELRLPDVSEVVDDWLPMSGVEMAAAHAETYPSHAGQYGAALAGLIEIGRAETAVSFFERSMRRLAYRERFNALFDSVDAVIMPTIPFADPSAHEMAALGASPGSVRDLIRYTVPSDLSGNPALVLPGTPGSANRPVTFQLVAQHYDEGSLLALGHSYQSATDWHLSHPDI